MNNSPLKLAAKYIREYVTYDICNEKITIGLLRSFSNYTKNNTIFSATEEYISWLEKEIDDENAMFYSQKPSENLPDDTIVAVFHKNVWEIMSGRKRVDQMVKEMFNKGKYDRKNPLCIKMAFSRGWSNEADAIDCDNDYYHQIKKRTFDSSLVEIVQLAASNLQDDAIVVKIYGDIWSKGELFQEFPHD